MLNIDLTLNLLTLFLIVLAAGTIGFISRNRQVRRKQMKIAELRREMVKNHAQILEIQKEYVELEMKMRNVKAPVLPLKSVVIEMVDEEKKVADANL